MDFVYSVEGAKQGELKKVLDEDSLAKDSFACVGFTLKEGKNISLEAGRYYLIFTADGELVAKLKERLAKIAEIKEEQGDAKQKALDAVKAEGDAAASGFGAIFG